MSRSKLTPDMIETVAEIVGRGNFRKTAFAICGIPHHTWKHWILIGKAVLSERAHDATPEHAEMCMRLVLRLDQVEGKAEDEVLTDIVEKAQEDWKAGAWYLERRHNKKYSRNPNAHWDDEEAIEVKIDAKDTLRQKLSRLLDTLGPSLTDDEDGDE